LKDCQDMLWIPRYSGKSTYAVNLNHTSEGFDINYESLLGEVYVGYNSNCLTPYVIVPIPSKWKKEQYEKKLEEVSKEVFRLMDKPKGHPLNRAIKADERLLLIIALMNSI